MLKMAPLSLKNRTTHFSLIRPVANKHTMMGVMANIPIGKRGKFVGALRQRRKKENKKKRLKHGVVGLNQSRR